MPCPWWIAGGFAIELAIGRPVRDHGDIDVLVLRQESSDGDWVSRRNPGIRRPIAGIGKTSADGIPSLAPEIRLFYKAKNLRPKDETDFTAVLPFVTQAQRQWLSDAIARTRGDHPWRDRLCQAPAAGS
jgi:hypothetical protein